MASIRPCLVICPGMHPPQLSQQMIADLTPWLPLEQLDVSLFETHDWTGKLSGYRLRQQLQHLQGDQRTASAALRSLLFLAFSAGCIGAISAAHHWQHRGGTVLAFFAMDGWGVPLAADFPIYRLSHDRWTHDTSALLGTGGTNFYADPPVAHRTLWSQPSQVEGWQVSRDGSPPQRLSAAIFLNRWLIQAVNAQGKLENFTSTGFANPEGEG